MKPFLLISFLLFQVVLARYETTVDEQLAQALYNATADERLYYRGTINDATFQLELIFNGDNLVGRGYDEQGNVLSLSGRRDTETNTITFRDANSYSSYLAAFGYDYDSQSYFLNGVRISDTGTNEPFTLRLIASYSSVAFKSGSLESTLTYPLWLGNYETFNRIGAENFQDSMVNLAYSYFKKQQNLPVLEESYENEPVSRNAITEIRFASLEFVSLLIYEDSYGSAPIESFNILIEDGTTRRLELSDILTDGSSIVELVVNDLKGQAETEEVSLTDKALDVFTLSPAGLSFHIPTTEFTQSYFFQNNYTVTLSLDELGNNVNPSILELLR